MIRFVLPAIALLAAGASAAPADRSDQAELDRALSGYAPGAEVDCVRPDDVTQLRTFKGVILYNRGRNTIWRNDVGEGCMLGRDDLLVIFPANGHYCAGDQVQTRHSVGGAISGFCTLIGMGS